MPTDQPADLEQAADAYLHECQQLANSGQATNERSYYPAVNTLLRAAGSHARPPQTTIPEPAALDGNFPDVALYDAVSQVLTLPVEVKPETYTHQQLLELPQGHRYAERFGGGHVLLTNLKEFVWAELYDDGNLTERGTVQLTQDNLDTAPDPTAGAAQQLAEMLEAACAVRATITDPDLVASLLAYHARQMVTAVEQVGDPQALLRPLAQSMRDGLGMHLDDEFFTPTVIQTLIYGLFAAWLDADNPRDFSWSSAGYVLRVKVIAELFHEISSPGFVQRCDLRGHLDAAARVLTWVDRETFTEQFDNYAIEYFYEPFLTRFDPELRDKLGVWYTPRQIAEYQVRRIDHHLKTNLDIPTGLADDNVLVLDPACGTGTYLRAALDHIYQHHLANNEPQTVAAQRTLNAALDRIVGFEILPAAFVIAHLHLHRHLNQQGATAADGERLRVYLTNSLTGWGTDPEALPPMPLPGLEDELLASLKVKTEEPVLVILGNPPYEGYSAAESEEEQQLLNDWIEPLWPEYGLRKHRLGDLYIRFWRIAVRKIAELTGRGIISFITNRKWLGGRSFPAMRQHIAHAFTHIVVDDLHGDVHEDYPGDGSIFTTDTATGIQRGVAITTTIRTSENSNQQPATVQIRDLRGSGQDKRRQLATFTAENLNTNLEEHSPTARGRWKLIPTTAGDDPVLDEYFDFFLSGVQPVRDEAVLSYQPQPLQERMEAYYNADIASETLMTQYPGFAVDRSRYNPTEVRTKLLRDSQYHQELVVPFLYKPFDQRWLYWETQHKLLNEARRELLKYFLEWKHDPDDDDDDGKYVHVQGQLSIVAAQTPRRTGAARPALTTAVPGFESVDPNARVIPRLLPSRDATPTASGANLQLDLTGQADEPVTYHTNVSDEWLQAAREAGLEGDDLDVGDTIFYSLIAVMYSPAWLDTIGTDNDDFAQVPLPADSELLVEGAELGRQIAALADPATPVEGITTGKINDRYAQIAQPGQTDQRKLTAGNTITGGSYDPDTQTLRWDDQHGWRNIPEPVWEYSVGGFQVLPKWLGYRHHSRDGYSLTPQDIETVMKTCRRIAALIDLQPDCDQIFHSAAQDALEPPAEPGTETPT